MNENVVPWIRFFVRPAAQMAASAATRLSWDLVFFGSQVIEIEFVLRGFAVDNCLDYSGYKPMNN